MGSRLLYLIDEFYSENAQTCDKTPTGGNHQAEGFSLHGTGVEEISLWGAGLLFLHQSYCSEWLQVQGGLILTLDACAFLCVPQGAGPSEMSSGG